MLGRLADTELPGRQRQGEMNPDQIQCRSIIWIMLNVLEISQQCVWEKTMIDLCLQAVVEVFTFFFYLIKNDFFMT